MFDTLVQKMNPIKTMLIAGSILSSCMLILLNNGGVFPLALGDFLFFSGLVFLCALYRPGWAFLFFIGWLPFEIINIAPLEIGMLLRPYQWIGILTIGAVATRFFTGRLPFALPKIQRLDVALGVVWLGSFVTALYSPERGINLKQSIVLLSFIALYALVRIFIRTKIDVKNTTVFFLGSGIIISLYALWQNIRFNGGRVSFEVMAGRPNSGFSEPDWLGVFLVVCIGALYAILATLRASRGLQDDLFQRLDGKISFTVTLRQVKLVCLLGALMVFSTALILSVARSAWLGTMLMTAVAWGVVLIDGTLFSLTQWKWRTSLLYVAGIAATFAVSMVIVFLFHLTSFQLFNRAQSTVSGLQRITVACDKEVALPVQIVSIDELVPYNCRHITLEEREDLRAQGESVQEVYRSDPNVNIRRDIYKKTFRVIREHFVFGVGFGSIHSLLGNDERGAGLNASNIFLEVWLGSGLIGLIAFVFVWFSIGVTVAKRLLVRTIQPDIDSVYFFLFISWSGLTIFNLFNAGILLGFFWAWLAVAVSFVQKK